MIDETLALALQAQALEGRRFQIGEDEWRESDYRQILIWAKSLELEPVEVVRRLQEDIIAGDEVWIETRFADGRLLELYWNLDLLPLERFEWVDGLVTKAVAFATTQEMTPNLSLRLPSLKDLLCAATGLTALDLSGVPMLTELWCYNNQLAELDLSAVPVLTRLWCDGNQLKELDVIGVPMLKELWCDRNHLTKLDLFGVPLLMGLWCSDNQLTELDLSGVPKLTELCCEGNQLTELDLSGVPMLTELYCGNNRLTKLNLSSVPMLTHLDCGASRLTELDIRFLLNLEKLQYDSGSTRLIQRADQHF